jgi:hypothetical protein
MRTTVDIPDELFRRIKAQAALEGVSLREVVERALRLVLAPTDQSGRRVAFPLHRSRRPGALSSEGVARAEEAVIAQEDLQRGRSL